MSQLNQSLIGAGVGATIQVALQNVIQGPIDEIIRVCGVDEDMEELKSSLLMIQDFVSDAEMKQLNSTAAKRWLEQLEDVVFEADLVLDEFSYEILRRKVEGSNQGWTDEVTDLFSCGLFRKEMADKIKALNKKLVTINNRAKEYGLQMAVLMGGNAVSATAAQLLTNSFSVEHPRMIGRDDVVLRIVNMLVRDSLHEMVSVLPVVGMGGLGKTSLARKVFNHDMIGACFPAKIWVCVSVTFDALVIFKMILEKLTGSSVHQGMQSEDAVLDIIQEKLAGRKYLLVLDDVWSENANQWDSFLCSLSGVSSVKGNCIIVTTRSGVVASNVQTLSIPPLRELSADQCWSIIKSKAFQRADHVPTEMEQVGRLIAQQCSGLPLAAKVVGGLLRGKSYVEWQSILTNQLSKFGPDDTVTKILKLSYDRLPSHVHKKCFTFCSFYPQDYKIDVKELIELWMAEGFLQAHEGRDKETLGVEIFNHLMHNSFFQDEERDEFGYISHCQMHDMVHDLSCSIAKSLHRVRHIAVNETDAIPQEHKNYLRTLFAMDLSRRVEILPHQFSDFKCLYSLKLLYVNLTELPESIGELIHLKFLDLSSTGLKQLPDSIGKLYNLETLRLDPEDLLASLRCALKTLPHTIVNLISLRHLYITAFLKLPPAIGKLSSIRTLNHFKVGHEEGHRIAELGKLKNLQGDIEIRNLERVKDKEEAMQSGLLRKSKIFSLRLGWSEAGQDERNDEHVLDGLQPHPSLKSLVISGYCGRSFPSWAMRMESYSDTEGRSQIFSNLIKISIFECVKCEEVPMLGHLPHLKSLSLGGLPKVRTLGHSFYGTRGDNTSSMIGNTGFGEPGIAFRALEGLSLRLMSELSEWTEVDGAFTGLKNLEVGSCPKLRRIPSHLPCLEGLTVFDVGTEVDEELSLDVCRSTSHLKSIDICGFPGSIYLPHDLFAKNPNLTELMIDGCPNKLLGFGASLDCAEVESIPSAKAPSSLRKLIIGSCDNLRALPLDLNGLLALEELRIIDCPDLESISNAGGGNSRQGLTSLRNLTIHSCDNLKELPINLNSLQSLEELSIKSCSGLESVSFAGGESQQVLTSLRSVCFWACLRLTVLPTEFFESCSSSLQDLTLVAASDSIREICCLRSLRHLKIGYFSESVSFDSFNQDLNDVLHELCSLETLCLYGEEFWGSVPDQIQHLTSLKRLELHSFGIEVLPEWIGNISSLEWLEIHDCGSLRRLLSKEAILRLTKLQKFHIIDCPLLKERCRNQQGSSSLGGEDSEWHKISHIPNILIS